MELSLKDIKEFNDNYNKHPEFRVSANALTGNSFKSIVLNNKFVNNFNEVFKKVIDIEVKATDQHGSGRCWLFAYLNIIRLNMVKKYGLNSDFELSQTHLFFYDKLEKSNYFLHCIMDNINEKHDSRKVIRFLNDPISDGGTTNMAHNLVKKYGLVPKNIMKETYQSKSTNTMNVLINQRLRHAARDLFENKKNRNSKFIKGVMADIYTMLVIFLGEPPKVFDWEYYSKKKSNSGADTDGSNKNKRSKKTGISVKQGGYEQENVSMLNSVNYKQLSRKNKRKGKGKGKMSNDKYKVVKNLTPLDFYTKYSGFNADDMVTLIHYPGKPFNKLYNVDYSNNMVGGLTNNYINVKVDLMKILSKLSIDEDKAVWFGSDVGKYMSKKLGILDRKAFNYKDTIGFDYDMSGEDMLKYQVSAVSHAMILKGYTMNKMEIKGKNINMDIDKWLVENSWGDMTEKHGNFTMSDEWFSEFVYEIMIDKKYLSKKILGILKTKPVVLPMWDPFGNLL